MVFELDTKKELVYSSMGIHNKPSSLVLSFCWQRVSGSPHLAIAHCSVPRYFWEASYNSYLNLTPPLNSMLNSTLCPFVPHCSIISMPPRLTHVDKKDSDFLCSLSIYVSDNSLELKPLIFASCRNHMFNDYISWRSVCYFWSNQRLCQRTWLKCNQRSLI